MSRILRRPMFRGGRVDSRGTGITSGLGYAKGGSVNTPKRGLVDGPGGYAGLKLGWELLKAGARPAMKYGKKGLDWMLTPKGGWSDKVINNPSYLNILRNMGSSRAGQGIAALNPMKDPLVGGVVKIPLGATKLLGKGIKKSPYGAAAVGADYVYNDRSYLGDAGDWIKEKYDEIFPGEKEGGREFVGEEAEIVGDPRDLPTEQETLEQIIAKIKAEEEAKREELIAALTPKKLTEDEKVAEIEKKKKMFEKVYGSGKGDDATNMLLSFAGKALKEGATTKSAFSDFFEEESKRPSESKKYKDAAAQAAIQSFLTGETSYQKFQDDLLAYSNKLNLKGEADKAAKQDLSFAEIKAGLPGTLKDREKTKTAAELFIQYTDPGKSLTVIEANEETPELLEAPENEGLYFMNRDTKEVFKIVKGIKQVIYGG